MPAIDRDGIAIHYEVTGADTGRPPLLLSHGFGASGAMWAGNLPALGRDRLVVTWDIRGHGRSASPADPARYTVAATLDDMVAVLDAIGASKAVLGGHSLGGYLSLLFAAARPERVAGLVLVNSGPGFRAEPAREKWNRLAERIATRFDERGLAAVSDSPEVGPGPHDPAGLALAARGILRMDDSAAIDALPGIAAPTLVVVGGDDHLYLDAAAVLTAKLPAAELVTIAGAGHASNIDRPEEFAAAVTDFLDRLG